MPKIYEHEFIVSEDVIDDNGHVNNVTYVKWMQDVAVMHSRARGFGISEYRNLGVTWVVRSHHIEYVASAFLGDRITALTWVARLSRSGSIRKYKFVRAEDSKVLARAETNWVYFNTKTSRPCAIHEEVFKSFEVVTDSEEP